MPAYAAAADTAAFDKLARITSIHRPARCLFVHAEQKIMARERAYGQTTRRKLPLIWLCVCSAAAIAVGQSESLTTIVSSSPPALQDDTTYSTEDGGLTTATSTSTTTTTAAEEEETSLAPPSTERTSNAIPEAEQSTSDLLKKYNPKKLDKDSPTQLPEQLDKPYPYLKKSSVAEKEAQENAIRQSKRSGDSLALNGTLKLSISSQNNPPESSQNAKEATTTTTTTTSSNTEAQQNNSEPTTTPAEQDVASSMTPIPASSTTTTASTTFKSEDETTIEHTQRTATTDTSTPFTEKSSAAGDAADTESTDTLTTQSTAPTTLSLSTTTLPTSTAATFSTNQSDAPSPADTNVPTTITETLPTTLSEEPSPTTTPPVEQDHSTLTTSEATVAPVTVTTTEPTVVAASTRIAPATTLLPVTTLTTTPISTTATIAKPSTTIVSPKRTAATTMTSEGFSAITTWQDETSEPTTEAFSPTPPPEDVTLLVRIVLEGSWQDVCSKLPILRQSLTDLLNDSTEKRISTRQIIFHQTKCSENLTPTSLATDTQLTPVLVYVVDENGSFDGKLTKILPSLHESSPIDFPLAIHSVTLVPEADSGNAIAVVIVSCVAFICLILLAGLLFIMRKRQGRFNYGERCRPVSLDAYSLDSVSAYNSVRRSKAVVRSSKRSYGNPAFEDSSVTPTHPLNFAGISTFCNEANAVGEEFVGIPQIHSKIEELPPGAEIKNRYANVIPLPETRVPLQKINNDPLSEYINASYVRGPKNATKYYIACQAPTEATVADFWRMIWEQQCKVIIMLTDLVENGVDKCTEYIPPLEVSDCHRLYGDYQVTLKKREAKEKYAISTLHLKNLENNTFREVSHIWYLWPASGVPTDAAGLIAVLLEARALQRGAAGPILVHCSPGTGRTGTLIALDLCIRQYEVTRTVDVPRVVYTIRRDRAGAVQTREQYFFIYKGLNLYASKLAGGGIDST